MSGTVTDLKSPDPLDERDHLQNPVFPMTKRYRRCDEIIGEGELVVEEMKEDVEEDSHKVYLAKKKGLT